jgi:hypothetical protein
MNRPLGLSDPCSATATGVFAPPGTDIGAASEPGAVMLVSFSSAAKWIVNKLTAAFDAFYGHFSTKEELAPGFRLCVAGYN